MIPHSRVLLLWLIGSLGTLMFVLATAPWGVAIQSDSLEYICMAKFLSTGHVPSFHGWPACTLLTSCLPFYPFCLSIMDQWGINFLDGMRWFYAVLFGFNIVLVGFILIKHTKAFWPALSGAVVMFISPAVLTVSMAAMTELLYIFFLLLFLLLFFDYMERPHWVLLIPAALAVSLSAITRYAGIPLICTGMAGIFLCRNTPPGKIKHAVVFSLISMLPMAVWFYKITFLCEGATDRAFIFHPSIVSDYFYKSASIFCGWLLPGKFPRVIKECVLVTSIAGLATVGFLLFKKRSRSSGPTNYSLLLVTFIFFYITSLIITILFFDAYVEPSQRTFFPIYVAGVVLCLGLIPPPWGKIDIVKIGLAYFLAIYSIEAVPWLRHLYTDGSGYGNKHWKQSQTLSRIMSLPVTVPVYTNVLTPVYIFRGDPVFQIPMPIMPLMNKVNNRYPEDLAEMEKVLKKGAGIVVYFNDAPQDMFIEPAEKIKQRLPLQLIAVYSDGQIYKIK